MLSRVVAKKGNKSSKTHHHTQRQPMQPTHAPNGPGTVASDRSAFDLRGGLVGWGVRLCRTRGGRQGGRREPKRAHDVRQAGASMRRRSANANAASSLTTCRVGGVKLSTLRPVGSDKDSARLAAQRAVKQPALLQGPITSPADRVGAVEEAGRCLRRQRRGWERVSVVFIAYRASVGGWRGGDGILRPSCGGTPCHSPITVTGEGTGSVHPCVAAMVAGSGHPHMGRAQVAKAAQFAVADIRLRTSESGN